MEFKHEQSLDDIKELLADLANPWKDPFSLSGYGTPFQIKIRQFPNILEANTAVDIALADWAASVNPQVVLDILVEIITNRPDASFHNNLTVRRKDQWDGAIGKVLNALETSHRDAVGKLLELEQMSAVRTYFD